MFPVRHTCKHEYRDIYIKCHMAGVIWYYIASAKILLYNAHKQGEKKQETDIFCHFEIIKMVIKPAG